MSIVVNTLTGHTALETDLRLGQVLSQEVALLLADRTSIRHTGAVQYVGSINTSGSDSIRVRLAGLDGYDAFAAASDEISATTAVTPTDTTDASADVTVARYTLVRQLSDLADMTSTGPTDISVERLAASMVGEAEKCFMNLLGGTLGSFTADAGTATVDLSVDDWFEAMATLEQANNAGPYTALISPLQLSDLKSSIRAEAGALQFMVAGAGMDQSIISAKGVGYAGSFLGCDVYTSSSVSDTGGTCYGAMWAPGALGYADGIPVIGRGDTARAANSPLVIEFDRDGASALTKVIGHYYIGMAILQDGKGTGITTDGS